MPAHFRLFAGFFLYSYALGSLFSRIADIQIQLGIDKAQLGLLLLGPAIGSFVMLTFGGHLMDRFNARFPMMAAYVLLALLIAIEGGTHTALIMLGLFLAQGLAIGVLEVVLNVEADRVEYNLGHRVMNRCHGFWSLGFFAAGLAGAAIRQADIPADFHLGVNCIVISLLAILLFWGYRPAPHRPAKTEQEAAPRFAWPNAAIMALFAITLSPLVLEGGSFDWSVIYMRDTFDAPAFVNGLGLALVALTMAIARTSADWFVDRFGPLAVARVLTLVLGAGTLLVALALDPYLSLFGFTLIGLGASVMFPLTMSAAAQLPKRNAAVNVAALSQTAFVAFLGGPPILGFVAEHFGAQSAFAVCLPLVVLTWFFLPALAPNRAEAK